MSLHAYMHAEVETVEPGTTVADAARKMDERNVGSLIVEDGGKPIGILTDRDIVVRVVCVGADADGTLGEEVMTPDPIALAEELSLFEALEIMKDEGVRRFLRSRGIALPDGAPGEEGTGSVHGLANLKNGAFGAWLSQCRVPVFEDARAFIETLRADGIGAGIFSASRNMGRVLASAGIAGLFDASVDGAEAARLGLAPKPDPATLVETARRLGAAPAACAVVEDAVAGVEAGRTGGFALVVGIDRRRDEAQDRALRAHGADIVVGDLRLLLTPDGRHLARAAGQGAAP